MQPREIAEARMPSMVLSSRPQPVAQQGKRSVGDHLLRKPKCRGPCAPWPPRPVAVRVGRNVERHSVWAPATCRCSNTGPGSQAIATGSGS